MRAACSLRCAGVNELFGTDPMDDYVAAAVGGIVVGIGGWFVLGVLLGLNA
jgi:hypothetical protein